MHAPVLSSNVLGTRCRVLTSVMLFRQVIQCVDTLVEVVQNPCRTNQLVLMDTQLPHVLNQFLQMPADFPVQFDDIKIYERNVEELKTGFALVLCTQRRG